MKLAILQKRTDFNSAGQQTGSYFYEKRKVINLSVFLPPCVCKISYRYLYNLLHFLFYLVLLYLTLIYRILFFFYYCASLFINYTDFTQKQTNITYILSQKSSHTHNPRTLQTKIQSSLLTKSFNIENSRSLITCLFLLFLETDDMINIWINNNRYYKRCKLRLFGYTQIRVLPKVIQK